MDEILSLSLNQFLNGAALIMEVMGVSVILIGALVSSFLFCYRWQKYKTFTDLFDNYRLNVARGILLGLEFLVAADIIGTVLVSPTLQNVIILGAIVIIRTFLSYSLEIEIHGRFPWQRGRQTQEGEK